MIEIDFDDPYQTTDSLATGVGRSLLVVAACRFCQQGMRSIRSKFETCSQVAENGQG